jgi:oxygen-independent coproporphyrinogen-3 oxidase
VAEDWRAGGFGVYVHWPFCAAKCPYCDFNSHVAHAPIDQAQWRTALCAELSHARALSGPRTADTIFFGGGTPSLMPPETVAAVIEAVDRLWGLAPDAEITLEANPTSVEADRFTGFARAGVNRISMGIQALNDADLKALGRQHTAQEARDAFAIARDRFDRVSFDLIYARMGQSLDAWLEELDIALSMAVDHLSLYQLTIEQGTRFAELHARGRLIVPDDDKAADMFEATRAACAAAGMPAYEVSNHARAGAESRHNLIYWRHGDYAGAGPGAHGRLTVDGRRVATETRRSPAQWLDAVSDAGHAMTTAPLTADEQATEYLLMAMRLTEGASLARYAALAGHEIDAARLGHLCDLGLISLDRGRIVATAQGVCVLNALLQSLLAD